MDFLLDVLSLEKPYFHTTIDQVISGISVDWYEQPTLSEQPYSLKLSEIKSGWQEINAKDHKP
jgi:hypothetical protein